MIFKLINTAEIFIFKHNSLKAKLMTRPHPDLPGDSAENGGQVSSRDVRISGEITSLRDETSGLTDVARMAFQTDAPRVA